MTASARRALGAEFSEERGAPTYWLDLGNRATDGQFLILGMQQHGIDGEAHPLVEGSSLGVLRDPGAVADE